MSGHELIRRVLPLTPAHLRSPKGLPGQDSSTPGTGNKGTSQSSTSIRGSLHLAYPDLRKDKIKQSSQHLPPKLCFALSSFLLMLIRTYPTKSPLYNQLPLASCLSQGGGSLISGSWMLTMKSQGKTERRSEKRQHLRAMGA